MKAIISKVYNKQKEMYYGILLKEVQYCCNELEEDEDLQIDYILTFNPYIGIDKVVGYELCNVRTNQFFKRCPYCLAKNEFELFDFDASKNIIDDIKYRKLRKIRDF